MGTYQGRHALIFAAAPETDYGYIRAFLREHPDALVACADGGLRHARALGLHPDFMISDRDSMTEVEGDDVILLRPEKDDTDSQSCLREVFRRGCREATLVCATGGRIDHMLANLSLLEEAKTLGGHLTILDPYNRVELHQGGRQEFIMPDDQKRGLMAVFDEFEADETAEAHFAHAMDNLQPLLLNNSNGGSDWADHDVTAKQVYGRQSRTEKGSAYLYKLTDNILQANIKKGALKEK